MFVCSLTSNLQNILYYKKLSLKKNTTLPSPPFLKTRKPHQCFIDTNIEKNQRHGINKNYLPKNVLCFSCFLQYQILLRNQLLKNVLHAKSSMNQTGSEVHGEPIHWSAGKEDLAWSPFSKVGFYWRFGLMSLWISRVRNSSIVPVVWVNTIYIYKYYLNDLKPSFISLGTHQLGLIL